MTIDGAFKSNIPPTSLIIISGRENSNSCRVDKVAPIVFVLDHEVVVAPFSQTVQLNMARICAEMHLAKTFQTTIRARTRRASFSVSATIDAESALSGRRDAISLGVLSAQLALLPKASALIPANDDDDEECVLCLSNLLMLAKWSTLLG